MSWAINLAVVIVQRSAGILADAIKLRHLVAKLIGNINSPSLPVVQVIIPHCIYMPMDNQYNNLKDWNCDCGIDRLMEKPVKDSFVTPKCIVEVSS